MSNESLALLDGPVPSADPLYVRLVQALREDIRAGRFPVGSRLPSEDALRQRHGVSRHTVREALRQLRAEGLVAPRKGAGTTVLPPNPPAPYVHQVASIEQLVDYATGTQYEVDRNGPMMADATLAARLGCRPGDSWVRIEGLRYAPGQAAPICWMEVYVRAEYADILRMVGRRPGPLYAWIEDKHGVTISEVEQVLSGRDVPARLARKLGVKPGSAGVEVRRTYRLRTGLVAEVAFNLHPASRFRYAMTLRRSDSR